MLAGARKAVAVSYRRAAVRPPAPSPRLPVLLLVAALVLSGCHSIQTPPPATLKGRAGSEGDAGWARVMQMEPGQRVFVAVRPPVPAHPGIELRPLDSLVPPSDGPPFDVVAEYAAELVLVSEEAIVIHPPDPLTLPRERVTAVSVLRPGTHTETMLHHTLGVALLFPVAVLIAVLFTDDGGTTLAAGGAASGAVLLTNLLGPPEARGRTALYLLPFSPPIPADRIVDVPAEIVQTYAGDYRAGAKLYLNFTVEQGRLTVQRGRPNPGRTRTPLYPLSATEFATRRGNQRFVFVREAGEVVAVIVREAGRELTATRVR